MKNLILFFAFSLFAMMLSAQIDNFKSGYILTLEGDTVFGQIDLRADGINQQQCRFLPNGSSKYIIYKPNEIDGYFFTDEGKFYVSKNIEINGNKLNVFIEFLVKGMMNLYYYEYADEKMADNQNYSGYKGYVPYYFFENEDGSLLAVKQNPDSLGSYRTVIPDIKYKGILKYYFRDIQPVVKSTDNLSFNQKSFIKVAQQYHGAVCTTGEECIVYKNPKPDKTGLEIGIAPYAGFQFIDCRYYFNLSRTSVFATQTYSPVIGAEATIKNPRWTNRFGFQGDLSLSYFHNPKETLLGSIPVYYPNGTLYYMDNYFVNRFNALVANVHIGVQFMYPKYRFRPVIGTGFSLSAFLIDKIIIKYDDYNYHNAKIDTGHFGLYGYIGFDYRLKNSHSVIFRLNCDILSSVSNLISIFTAKLGYSF